MTQAEAFDVLSVQSLAGDEVAAVPPDATLLEVVDALASDQVGLLAVKDGADVVGVVSERDVITAIAERRPLETTTALDVASTAVRWCDVSASVLDAAEEMLDHYVRHLLLEVDGQLAGIVSMRDLLGVLVTDAEPVGDAELERER